MSINTLGAVVSDNDGSAFITKAEFDSLKNNFQSQIDQYNTSIDSKIDGAIASYLSGINLSKKEQLTLDPKSRYLFPLKMHGSESLWNDSNSDYYDVMNIEVRWIHPEVKASNMKDYSATFLNVPMTDVHGDILYKADALSIPASDLVFRIGLLDVDMTIPGVVGSLNLVSEKGTYRSVDGANRKVYKVDQAGRGKLFGLWKDNLGIGGFGDGWSNDRSACYAYTKWLGFGNSCFSETRDGDMQWNADNLTYQYWYRGNGLRSTNNNFQSSKNTSVSMNWSLPGGDTVSDCITNWNSWKKNTFLPSSSWGNYNTSEQFLGDPIITIYDWTHTNGFNNIFYGDAFMPASKNGYWNYIPNRSADPSKVRMRGIYKWNRGAHKVGAWNASTRDTVTLDWYIGYVYEYMPFFEASPITNYANEGSNHFSQLRASIVSYEDSNGKTHYMDEGMYLGHYDKEGNVEFVIKFNGAAGKRVNFALSKKPFGFDCSDTDRIKFKFKVTTDSSATAIDIPTGGYGYIDTNYSIKVNVDDIEKNDELYMMWWPENTGDYVELDNITEYYLETTG